jgi:copper transport protein
LAGGTQGVFAHALLERSDPQPGVVLPSDRAPSKVALDFSESVEIAFNGLAVVDAGSRRVDRLNARVTPENPRRVEVDVANVAEDAFVVRWQVTSADNHVVRGTYWFGVGFASAPPGGGLFSTGAPTVAPLEVVARWLGLAAVLALMGAPLFSRLVLQPVRSPTGSPLPGGFTVGERWVWLAVGTLLVGSHVLWAAAQVESVAGVPILRAWDPAVVGVVLAGSRFAVLWWARLLLGLILTGLLLRRTDTRLQLVVGGALLVTTALAGHASSARVLAPVAIGVDVLHLGAAAVWLGGLAQIALLFPRASRSLRPAERAELLRTLVPRVSRVALISVGVLIVTGTFSAWEQVGNLDALTTTAYGQTLGLKLLLLIPILGVAAVNLLVVRPRASAGAADPFLPRRFHALVGIETLLGGGVLLTVGLLVSLPPPAQQVRPAPIEAARQAGDLRVGLTVDPNWIGISTYRVSLADAQGRAPADVANVVLTFTMEGMNMGRTTAAATPVAEGLYQAQGFYNGMPGIAQLGVAVSRTGGADQNAVFQIEVPDTTHQQFAGLRPTLGIGPVGLFGLAIALLGALGLSGVRRELASRRGLLAQVTVGVVALAGAGAFFADRSLVNPSTASSDDLLAAVGSANSVDGRAVYAVHCVVCHGETGVGNGPAAASLLPPPADLTLHARWHAVDQLYWFISHGVRGTAMPSFADQLSPAERRNVIAYLQEMAAAPTATASRPAIAVQPTPAQVAPLSPTAVAGPTGGLIVFGPDNDTNLWLLRLPDGKPERLTSLKAGEFSSSPAWSPDGKQIAFSYYKLPANSKLPVPDGTDLYVVNADGSGPRMVAQHDIRGATLQNPVWRPDGSAVLVAYQARPPTGGLDLGIDSIDIATGERTRLVANASYPSISKDGQRLAYVRLPAGEVRVQTLWWSASDGSDPHQILGPNMFLKYSGVRFAPNGEQIVFAGIGDGTNYREPSGGRLDLFGLVGRWLEPGIAYANGEEWDLWTIELTGRNLRRLTKLGEDLPVPAWSPDGQSIAFLGGGSGVTAQTGLAVIAADGRDLRRLTTQPGHRGVDWAPPPSGR